MLMNREVSTLMRLPALASPDIRHKDRIEAKRGQTECGDFALLRLPEAVGYDCQPKLGRRRSQPGKNVRLQRDVRKVIAIGGNHRRNDFRVGLQTIRSQHSVEDPAAIAVKKLSPCNVEQTFDPQISLRPLRYRPKAALGIIPLKIECIVQIEDHHACDFA